MRYLPLALLLIAPLASAIQFRTVAQEEAVDRRTKAALALDGNAERGKDLFRTECIACHGREAQGDSAHQIPALAGQRFRYLVRQLANFSGGERDSIPMNHELTKARYRQPQSWVDIAVYLNHLAPLGTREHGDGRDAALGRGIFHEQCASCHGADATGDESGYVPMLRHQHSSYLANQMRQLAEGKRHNVDESLVMFLRSFDERDIDGVADYLSRLGEGVNRKEYMRDDGTVVN